MKKISFILLIVIGFSYGQNSGAGIGLVLNEDLGIAGKYWLDRTNAIDINVTLKNVVGIGADYVWHDYNLIDSKFPIYYGVGVTIITGDASGFGINGVGGIDFLIKKMKIDVFLELVPTLAISPSSNFDMNWQLGARYFF